ncbi:MAG: murein DD-endopeptidase MepM/ murein hydrolase activator NlpD [Polaribacter sp.]|jgi:murein DD-endopeptidase MepM/ murein hydrolase activator NlpD
MEKKEEKNWLENLRKDYRLTVMNNETFEEVGAYKLSALNLYIILSAIIVAVAILVISLVVFTPIKRYIPGYGDLSQQTEAIRLNKEVLAFEKQLDAHGKYTENFRRMLVGDVIEDSTANQVQKADEIPDSLLNVDRIEEDEMLRQEIEHNEMIEQQALLGKTANYIPKDIPLEQIYFIPPVNGLVSESYAIDKKHYGVDVLAPKNTPILAALDGYVFTSDWTLETGNTVGIQHRNNIITFYKHNSSLLKKVGDQVKAGEAIAVVGNTGTLSNGPHLHFELWHNGHHVNPEDYIHFD